MRQASVYLRIPGRSQFILQATDYYRQPGVLLFDPAQGLNLGGVVYLIKLKIHL
jgi:hypothetical protein